jgi:hypothetical protein
MPYHTETRTFTIEVEVTATATIETGGGYSDEPQWAEVEGVAIDVVFVNGVEMASFAWLENMMIDAAKEEFRE